MTGFLRKDGMLTVDGLDLESLAADWGTPVYIYSAAAIEERFRHFRDTVAPATGKVHYAIKANSNLAVLRLLARLGAGADIVSAGEMQRALKAGFAAADIVFSGVGKTDTDITAALAAGIGQINAESEAEVMRVIALAESTGQSCRLALRINPDVAADTHAKISTGHGETKFGIPLEAIPGLYRRIAESGAVETGGLAVHIGSQIMDTAPFEHAWQVMRDLGDSLIADGFDVPVLDLGGGLGVDYATGAHADAVALGQLVDRLFGNTSYHLGFEPGRYLTAEAGVLLTKVIATKPAEGKVFTIVDGAMNDLIRPTLYEAFHRIEPVRETGAKAVMTDIVGPVCETGDYLGLGRMMPPTEAGDLLAVMSAGAYGAVMRSAYNTRPPAPEVMVIEGEAHAVSARQTVDELLALETIPAVLG
ncbi:MAG: diaminopimelate decarboxylase [Candidatus Puniceispirillales bacterium]